MAKKKNISLNNPFLDHGYVSPEYFCDRKAEMEKIISALHNGRNITLMAPRRIGKTGLIKNVFYHIKDKAAKAICVYADIFSTRSQRNFVNVLSQAVFAETKTPIEKAITILSQCRPIVGVDQFSGTPTLSFDIKPQMAEQNIRQLFDYIGNLDKECYIAIDEFQQITNYAEEGTEALLRSYIQFLPNAHFIFAGSRQHLMGEMFLSAQRPFYQSTQLMNLGVIAKDEYFLFAENFFNQKGGTLSKDVFGYAYNLVDGQTWYVQTILNRLYQNYKKVADKAQVDMVVESILDENSDNYQGVLSMLTDNQLALIKAIAEERMVTEPMSGQFVSEHHLTSPSSVRMALKFLTDHDLCYKTPKGYIVYDRFMGFWLNKNM